MDTTKGYFLFSFAVFLSAFIMISTKSIIIKNSIPVWETLAIFNFPMVILLSALIIKTKKKVFTKEILKLNLTRNLIYIVYIYFLYFSLTRIPANDAVSIQLLVPVISSVIAGIFLKETFNIFIIIALFVGLCGVNTIMPISFSGDILHNKVYFLMLVAVIARSVANLFNKIIARRFDTTTLMFYTHTTIFLSALCFGGNHFIRIPVDAFLKLSAVSLLYYIEYVFIYKSNKYCSVISLQPLDFTKIVYSIILSYLILGEKLTEKQLLGIIIIAISFIFMMIGKNKLDNKYS